MAVRDEQQRIANQRLLSDINNNCYFGEDLRKKEQELFNLKGQNVYIETPLRFSYGNNLHFSGKFYANGDCFFSDSSDIYFGKNVILGPRVQIYTENHPIDVLSRLKNGYYVFPVRIEDNVWIGGGVIINPNVVIGENSVVASGSVVTKSVPPNSFVAGVPAKVVRVIDNEDYYQSKNLEEKIG